MIILLIILRRLKSCIKGKLTRGRFLSSRQGSKNFPYSAGDGNILLAQPGQHVKKVTTWRELLKRPKIESEKTGFGKFLSLVISWTALSAVAYLLFRFAVITFPASWNGKNDAESNVSGLLWSLLWDRAVISESFWNYESSPLSIALTILACQTSLLVGVVFAGSAGQGVGRRASSFYSAITLIQIVALVLAILTPALLIDSSIWAAQRGGSGIEMGVAIVAGALVVCMGVIIGDPDLVLGFQETHLQRRLRRSESVARVLQQDSDKFSTRLGLGWVVRPLVFIVWVCGAAVAFRSFQSSEGSDTRYLAWTFLSQLVVWTLVTYATLIYMPFWDSASNYWGAKFVRLSMGMSAVLTVAMLAVHMYRNLIALVVFMFAGSILLPCVSKAIDLDVRSSGWVQRQWNDTNERRIASIKMQLGDENRTT